LKNIIESLGNANYARLRFGVGSEFVKGKQINHVLGNFAHEEQQLLPERLLKASEAIKSFGTIGLGRTMSDFNGK
jgi:PTH1 family peptidyl-tRNA hydrolase